MCFLPSHNFAHAARSLKAHDSRIGVEDLLLSMLRCFSRISEDEMVGQMLRTEIYKSLQTATKCYPWTPLDKTA